MTDTKVRLTRGLLLDAIEPVNGHVPSLQDLGERFGVSREWVRVVLQRFHILKGYGGQRYYCPGCQTALRGYGISRGACYECKPRAIPAALVTLQCDTCNKVFSITQSGLRKRLHLVGTRWKGIPRTTPLFCSKRCHGLWFGKTHGFPTRPANAAHNSRKTQCLRGHPFDEANTYGGSCGYTRKGGGVVRQCKTCTRARSRARYRAAATKQIAGGRV